MIQEYTRLNVADNSGAKSVMCIKLLGGSKKKYGAVGDIIVVSVKNAIPVKKSDAMMARTSGSKTMQRFYWTIRMNHVERVFLARSQENCAKKNL